jgi:hypothetical protein
MVSPTCVVVTVTVGVVVCEAVLVSVIVVGAAVLVSVIVVGAAVLVSVIVVGAAVLVSVVVVGAAVLVSVVVVGAAVLVSVVVVGAAVLVSVVVVGAAVLVSVVVIAGAVLVTVVCDGAPLRVTVVVVAGAVLVTVLVMVLVSLGTAYAVYGIAGPLLPTTAKAPIIAKARTGETVSCNNLRNLRCALIACLYTFDTFSSVDSTPVMKGVDAVDRRWWGKPVQTVNRPASRRGCPAGLGCDMRSHLPHNSFCACSRLVGRLPFKG